MTHNEATKLWDWRKAYGGVWANTDPYPERLFHAYNSETDNMACEPTLGLGQSCEDPNEGSHLCPACINVIKTRR